MEMEQEIQKTLMANYWAFVATPNVYRIDEVVQNLLEDTWTVGSFNIRAGDYAIIWKAKGSSKTRGVIGFAEVTSDPSVRDAAHPEYFLTDPLPLQPRVEIRYHVPDAMPLWYDGDPASVLGQLSCSRATGGTVFYVTPDQWNAVIAQAQANLPLADLRAAGSSKPSNRRTGRIGRIGLPDGIGREHLLQAIADLNDAAEHSFADSTKFDVLHDGKRYPPKAVVGVAARHLTGTEHGPPDFTGGLDSKCFRVLQENGFAIVPKSGEAEYPDEVLEIEHTEGKRVQVYVNRYERDKGARDACLKHHGTRCQVCLFDFVEMYGDLGKGFIHVHHRKPLSSIGAAYKVDPKNDLVPVCPNCHAMLHKEEPPLTVEHLCQRIAAVKTSKPS